MLIKTKFAKGGFLSGLVNLDSGLGEINPLQYHNPGLVEPFVNTGVNPEVYLKVAENINQQVENQKKKALSGIPDFEKVKEALKLKAHSGVNTEIGNQFDTISQDYNDKFSKDYNYAFTREGLAQKRQLIGLVDDARKVNAEQLYKDDQEDLGVARKNNTLGDFYTRSNQVYFKDKDGVAKALSLSDYDNLTPEQQKDIKTRITGNLLTQQGVYDFFDKNSTLNSTNRLDLGTQQHFDTFAKNVKDKFEGLGSNSGGGMTGVGKVNISNDPSNPLYQIGKSSEAWKNNASQIQAIKGAILDKGLLSQQDIDSFTANYVAKTGDLSGKNRDQALIEYVDAIAKGKAVRDYTSEVDYKNLPEDLSSASGGLPKPKYEGTGTYGLAVLGLSPKVQVPMQDSNGKIINITGNVVQELDKLDSEYYKNKDGEIVPLPINQTPVFNSAPEIYNAYGRKVPSKTAFSTMVYGDADKVIIDVPVDARGELDFDKFDEIETLKRQLARFPNSPGIQNRINQIKQNTVRVQKAEIVFNEDDADKLGRGKYYEGTKGTNIDAPFADRSFMGFGSELVVKDAQGNKHFNTKAIYLPSDDADAQKLEKAGFSNGQAYKTTIYIPISTIEASKIDQKLKTNVGENALNPQLPVDNILPIQPENTFVPFRGN